VGNEYEKLGHTVVPNIPLGGFLDRLVNAGMILSFYFSSFFLPMDLTPIYPKWVVNPASPLSYLPLLAMTGMVYLGWKKKETWGRHVLLGLGFFVLMLAPFLGFHAITYMHDSWIELHLLYLPQISLIGLFVAGLGNFEDQLSASAHPFVIGIMTAAIIYATWSARSYAGWFINEETLWARTLQRNPNAWLPHYDLGCNYLDQGRLPQAVVELKRSIELLPDFSDGYYNLGLAMDKMGRKAEAQQLYRKALAMNPEDGKSYINLADSLFKSGQADEAIQLYWQAMPLLPDSALMHYNLGNALLQTGRLPEAIAELSAALKLDPSLVQAHENLGVALAQSGNLTAAIEQFEAAIQLNPGYIAARENLALAFAQSGRNSEAVEQFQNILAIDPDNAGARQSLMQLRAYLQTAPAKK
jgi:tetratricopeptide (TPR) repeat protein